MQIRMWRYSDYETCVYDGERKVAENVSKDDGELIVAALTLFDAIERLRTNRPWLTTK